MFSHCKPSAETGTCRSWLTRNLCGPQWPQRATESQTMRLTWKQAESFLSGTWECNLEQPHNKTAIVAMRLTGGWLGVWNLPRMCVCVWETALHTYLQLNPYNGHKPVCVQSLWQSQTLTHNLCESLWTWLACQCWSCWAIVMIPNVKENIDIQTVLLHFLTEG